MLPQQLANRVARHQPAPTVPEDPALAQHCAECSCPAAAWYVDWPCDVERLMAHFGVRPRSDGVPPVSRRDDRCVG